MYQQLKAKQQAAAEAPPAGDPMMEMMGDAGLAMAPESPDTGMVPEPEEIDAMAMQGDNGDITMGHLTPGEVVVPMNLLDDPAIKSALMDMFASRDVDIEQYTVGSESNSINPDTGYPEFGVSGDDLYGWEYMVAQQNAFNQSMALQAQQQKDAQALAEYTAAQSKKLQDAADKASALRQQQADRESAARAKANRQAADARQARLVAKQAEAAEKKRVSGLVTSEMARRRGMKSPAKVGATAEAATFTAPVKERSAKIISTGPRPQRKAAGFYSAGDPGYSQNPLQRPR